MLEIVKFAGFCSMRGVAVFGECDKITLVAARDKRWTRDTRLILEN
jgi:hypothetical protein